MKSNKITVGILAHVDAGKTTLSESILYISGAIRKLGRVDHKDAFLDTYELEKARGITIFSKQAVFEIGNKVITLLDTPGHVDFSSEMERTLQVLDYAILVINGGDGVQGHTMTLWKLLKRYNIATFLFVNKMDQEVATKDALLQDLHNRLSENCIDFDEGIDKHFFWDKLAMCDEHLMEQYLKNGSIDTESIQAAIAGRKVFPVFFGSALKLEGVEAFLEGMDKYMTLPEYGKEFGAKVFKISRDPQGNRLTHMKITGGILRVKDTLTNGDENSSKDDEDVWKEKVDQIRIYSGSSYQPVTEAEAGTVCAVTGLSKTRAGDGLGFESNSHKPILTPVLTYQIILPKECDVHAMVNNLRQLDEEEPQLNIVWNDVLSQIHVQVMGEIEIEILKRLILDRFGVEVSFGNGSLMYKETIEEPVVGVGHFEPLKHYAEVHLLLEPGEVGSGLQFYTACSEDVLDRNWQRLILTHLEEKKHIGVLTGSEITDIKITLIAGRAHLKHTEGGDFRQATYRAVRHGLMKAKSKLLEPVYQFRLEVPKEMLGRAMADIQRMHGRFDQPEIEGETGILKGFGPVATMQGYPMEVTAYTKGMGRIFLNVSGYEPCHNEQEVIEAMGYDPQADILNPAGSVFCSHGAGFNVPWDQVEEYMHIKNAFSISDEEVEEQEIKPKSKHTNEKYYESEKELEDIFFRTYGPAKKQPYPSQRRVFDTPKEHRDESSNERKWEIKKSVNLDRYLLVDGYNIIFAWDELKDIAKSNMDAARFRLMDMLCNYQSQKEDTVIVVFDAYKVEGNKGDKSQYHNIHVVYTKEAETADQYIEKFVHNAGHKYDVTVATSDALEQMIIMSKGAKRLSAQGLKEELDIINREVREKFLSNRLDSGHYPFKESIMDEVVLTEDEE